MQRCASLLCFTIPFSLTARQPVRARNGMVVAMESPWRQMWVSTS